ncbi:MAG: tRNA (adenosine(37)-N6)-threonylcarbamoyltransferase complex dimerization subunit type 1 TsaB [bacterium]|nr:tRNA (adenosine(37)-N6)-threonylcarbamoyltransferase complex dimerization subunit type 1 TsaB [bacterium]
MIILGFDTCLDKMYVTLAQNDTIIDSRVIETTQTHYHSAFLISTIKDILKTNKKTPNDVELLTTNIGPGSFTGIRACTTVARVFAQAKNLNVIGISSLEIIANTIDTDKKVLVSLDARKGKGYCAIYQNGKELFAPKAVPLEELKEMVSNEEFEIITDEAMQKIIGGSNYIELNKDLGQTLTKLAYKKSNCKETDYSWSKLHPLYIQPAPVTIKKTVTNNK